MKKCTEEDPRISIRKICERCDVSVCTAERIVRDDLKPPPPRTHTQNPTNLGKVQETPFPNNQQKKKKVEFSNDLRNMFEPDGPKRLCGVITCSETWLDIYGIPNERSNQIGWLLTERDQLCFDQIPRVGSDCPPPLPQGPIMVGMVLLLESTLTTTYYIKTVVPEGFKSVRQQSQTVGSRRPLSFMTTPLSTKPRSL